MNLEELGMGHGPPGPPLLTALVSMLDSGTSNSKSRHIDSISLNADIPRFNSPLHRVKPQKLCKTRQCGRILLYGYSELLDINFEGLGSYLLRLLLFIQIYFDGLCTTSTTLDSCLLYIMSAELICEQMKLWKINFDSSTWNQR